MKGLALAVVGLWVILQSTYGPLATKLGLIAGVPSSSTPTPTYPGGSGPGGSYAVPPPGAPYKAQPPGVSYPSAGAPGGVLV